MVPAIGVDHPPVEIYTEPPPNLLPVSATVPTMERQIVSVSSPVPELGTPPTVSIILRSLAIVVANYGSLSRCPHTPLVLCLFSQMLTMSTCHMRQLLWLRM